jgi:type IV secretion system protein VirB1
MVDWTPIIEECAPQVAPPSTIHALIRTESGFNPFAININGGKRLARQPTSRGEAAGWVRWLITRGYSVDLGLMQINSVHLRRFGLDAMTAFDSCLNLQAGARILSENYSRALKETDDSRAALLKALSAYNTGDFQRGFRNGYVERVIKASVEVFSIKDRTPQLVVRKAAPRTVLASRSHEAPPSIRQGGRSWVDVQWDTTPISAHTSTTTVEGFHDAMSPKEIF